MRAGNLRRRLQLQRRVASTDAEGRPQENWVPISGIWAAVSPLTAAEQLVAEQAGVQITHQVTTRYRTDLAAPTGHNLRLVEGSRVLEIVSQPIDVDERHRELQIQARELEQG
jgi:SPP1 family predicted phage head-tail adaptor